MIAEVCRICGCTENNPCDLGDGTFCQWFDERHTLCTRSRCVGAIPFDELIELLQERFTLRHD